MKTTIITEISDRIWLCETHLKMSRCYAQDFKVAIIHGNEDYPQKVELFAKDHYRCIPTVYESDENGALVLNKDKSKNAGKLCPKSQRALAETNNIK